MRRASFLVAVLLAGSGCTKTEESHVVVRVALAEWLARPPREGEVFVADKPVVIKGMTEVAFRPKVAPNLVPQTAANDRWILAAFASPDGHRLLLAPETQMASLPHLSLAGVTVTPERIGLPPEPLAELGSMLKNVDTRYVTAFLWTFRDATLPGAPGSAHGPRR